MSTTRATLRQQLSEAIGDWRQSTTTSPGAAGGTTLIDSSLTDYENDWFNTWYAFPTSGANASVERIVRDFDSVGSTITVRAFASTVLGTVTYELHRIAPSEKHAAINAALNETFPWLHKRTIDDSIVINNVLTDPSLDTWSGGTLSNWTPVNTPTQTAETTRVWHGTALKLVADGGDTGQMTQSPTINQADVVNLTITLGMWVYADTASVARIALDFGSGHASNKYSDYHDGDREWQFLYAQQSVPANATRIMAVLEVATGGTAYFDGGYLTVGYVDRYTIPASIKKGPYAVYYNERPGVRPNETTWAPMTNWIVEDDGSGTRYLRLGSPMAGGNRLQLIGTTSLTEVSTDAGTTEIDAPRTRLLTAYAAMCLYRSLGQGVGLPISERDTYQKLEQYWRGQAALLQRQAGMRMPQPSAQYHALE